MKNEISEAIDELKCVLGEKNVEVNPDNIGGAYVTINNIDIGDKFAPSIIWCGFYINHMYPMSDIYPHFINPEIKLSNGEDLKGPFQIINNWNNRISMQVSRRSNRWNPAQDTAQMKLEKVLDFIKNI